jgi:hypothetical protein
MSTLSDSVREMKRELKRPKKAGRIGIRTLEIKGKQVFRRELDDKIV